MTDWDEFLKQTVIWDRTHTPDPDEPFIDPRNIPDEFHRHIANFASDTDRNWFVVHPSEEEYTRDAINPHEVCGFADPTHASCMQPPADMEAMVQVEKIPGVGRKRQPFFIVGENPSDEFIAFMRRFKEKEDVIKKRMEK